MPPEVSRQQACAERTKAASRTDSATSREPAKLEREQCEQQHTQPEFWRGPGGKCSGNGDGLDRRATTEGKERASDDAERIGQAERNERQDRGVWQRCPQDVRDRSVLQEGTAEVAAQQLAKVNQV